MTSEAFMTQENASAVQARFVVMSSRFAQRTHLTLWAKRARQGSRCMVDAPDLLTPTNAKAKLQQAAKIWWVSRLSAASIIPRQGNTTNIVDV